MAACWSTSFPASVFIKPENQGLWSDVKRFLLQKLQAYLSVSEEIITAESVKKCFYDCSLICKILALSWNGQSDEDRQDWMDLQQSLNEVVAHSLSNFMTLIQRSPSVDKIVLLQRYLDIWTVSSHIPLYRNWTTPEHWHTLSDEESWCMLGRSYVARYISSSPLAQFIMDSIEKLKHILLDLKDKGTSSQGSDPRFMTITDEDEFGTPIARE